MLVGIGTLALGLLLVVGLNYGFQRSSLQMYDRILDLSQKKVNLLNTVEIDRVLARRYERDYFLGREKRYLDLHKNQIAKMKKTIGDIGDIDKKIGLKNAYKDKDQLDKLLQSYSESFSAVVEATELRGTSKTGLIGALNKDGVLIDRQITAFSSSDREIAFLRIRQLQSDYEEAPSKTTAAAFPMRLGLLRQELATSGATSSAKTLGRYGVNFKKLTAVDMKLIELQKDLQDSAHTLDILLKQKEKEGFEAIAKDRQVVNQSGQRNLVLSLGLSIAVMLTGLLISLFMIRTVTRILHRTVSTLMSASGETESASGLVAVASEKVAEGTAQQAAKLEDTASSLTEIASQTDANAENAKLVSGLASEARIAAEQGNTAMEGLRDTMGRIDDSSQQIGNILKVIEEIAFQTNLLALNAAVEAARAGEQGRGFAVVAQEVRRLAQRAASAVRDTSDLVSDSQNLAGEGVKVTNSVNGALAQITDHVKNVADRVADITNACEEQSIGVNQINIAMTQIGGATAQSAEAAKQTAVASEQVASQATLLAEMVHQLRQLAEGSKSPVQSTLPQPALSAPEADFPDELDEDPEEQEIKALT